MKTLGRILAILIMVAICIVFALSSCRVAKKKDYEVETCQKTGIKTAIYKPTIKHK